MATESPIRFLEGTEKWSLPLKQSSRYRPSPSSKMAFEVDLLIGQSLQNIDLDGIPSRSESAPPSMEGSIAAIENILPLRESTLNPGNTDKGLPVHKEESEEDDRSSERSSSVDKAALLDHLSDSLDSTREDADSHTPHIPSFNTSIASMSANKSADGKKLLSLKIDVPSYTTSAVVSDVESSHLEAVQVINTSDSSSSETREFQRKDQQLIPPTYVLQQQANPHGFNTPRVQGSYTQIIYPGFSHPYGTTNQFYYGSSSAPMAALVTSPSQYYPNMQQPGFLTPQYNMGSYTFSTSALPPSYVGGYSYPPHGAIPVVVNSGSFSPSGISDGGNVHAYDIHNVQKFYGQVGFPMQPSAEPFQLQYVQQGPRHSYGSYGYFGHQPLRDDASSSSGSPLDSNLSNGHKPHNVTAGSPTNLDFRKGNTANHSPEGSDYPRGRFHRTYGNQRQNWNSLNSYSFLEELKSGKSQRFELSDITGYIGEFSIDQHGSRFIQQKLESCNNEEKASVFKEVIPLASKLMTDVFGNYVIQKLFEYGSPEQRKDLADQLEGQILPLSLQMYGCRVIQKALDVIHLDQKTKLVRELDGHVTTCVRDQNGNHVIQKCIESIPSDNINFVISSFRGQVATLSMHPYGCRVIQRVLEHCKDGSHTQFIVDEILDSVCSLAQHQYGNYVTQHVLERGKPHERRKIIEKLSRSIVQLSQHKFASNVVEKCLEYSDSAARDILLKEIVGDGNKNDNLWIMMKDQYANYVIQKILQKCSHDQREMLLGLIKNHLTALKKYTYGKHIVARFEELYGEEIQSIGS